MRLSRLPKYFIFMIVLTALLGGSIFIDSEFPLSVDMESAAPEAAVPVSQLTPRPEIRITAAATATAVAAETLPPPTKTAVAPAAVQVPDTPTPTPTSTWQAQEPYLGIWISREELARLPTSGPAWEQMKAAADQDAGEPDLRNQNQRNNLNVLAKALVYARTGERRYREEVIENIVQVMGTEKGARTLALGRNLVTYVVAADLVNLPADEELDAQFRAWLEELLTKNFQGQSLQSTHEKRPNNWGTHAGASRAAVAIYLGDQAELERTAQVFKGWLGDRSAYAGFTYGQLWWQADPRNPVGINPVGATKEGYLIDGALPEEMRRGGKFRWPPKETGYPWGALQGALVQAELLHRAGYPAWEWEEKALLRAVQFLYYLDWEPVGDDEWLICLVNYAYGVDFPISETARPGKNMGWTNWTTIK